MGRRAQMSGDPIAPSVGKCPHLMAALAGMEARSPKR
jgi:hypothetical protein